MTLLTILLGLWAMLLAARGSAIGATMQCWLVEKLAERLSRIHRNTVLTALTLAIVGLGCFWVIGHEGVLVYSMALPELTAALAMIDLGLMVDIAVVLVAAASSGRWRMLRMMAVRWTGGMRTPRARRTRAARKPAANDDDADGWAFALAA